MHETQVKKHVDSLYSKSDSEESYKVIESFSTEKELSQDKLDYTQQENHYSSNSNQENFSLEELLEVRDIIKAINNKVTVKMSELEQEYLAEL